MTKIKLCAAMLIFAAASIVGWRACELTVMRGEQTLFSLPASNGYRFTTGYQHSVELTPVEDEYAVAGGTLWNWQERVKSSNAGMPSIAPKRGKYINTKDWLIFQGGGVAQRRFYLRVGDANFGRNWMELPPYERAELYKTAAGERLAISAGKKPLALIKTISPASAENP